MGERGMQIKADAHKAQWEQSDFPVLCETCLGENPYIRMTKHGYGQACKMCSRPFTVFRWRPDKSRPKKTEICMTCAKSKNVCQGCLLDLTYGLPVQVRDAFLASQQAEGMQQATSLVGREYQNQQKNAAIANGENPYADGELDQQVLRVARSSASTARQSRHLPGVCSFFARGDCHRGKNCPYKHDIPPPPAPPARNTAAAAPAAAPAPAAAAAAAPARPARPNTYVEPPSADIKTLWLSPVDAEASVDDVSAPLKAHGTIKAVNLKGNAAFVEFEEQAAAAAAYKALFASLKLGGSKVIMAWAVPKKQASAGGEEKAEETAGAVELQPLMVPPPPPPSASAGAGNGAGNGAGSNFPAFLRNALPPPPGAYSAAATNGAAASGSGPQRRGRMPHASASSHPYAYPSMNPGQLGSRMRTT